MKCVRELKRPQSVIRLVIAFFLLTKHTVEQTVQMLNHFRPPQATAEDANRRSQCFRSVDLPTPAQTTIVFVGVFFTRTPTDIRRSFWSGVEMCRRVVAVGGRNSVQRRHAKFLQSFTGTSPLAVDSVSHEYASTG
jgi:hypothetical protein